MPVDNKKQALRAVLAGKTTEELEELLALDFTEQQNAEPNVDYIMTILEVIEEREGHTEKKQNEAEEAWREFQEYYRLRKQEEASETGTTGEPSHDHPRKTEYRQRPRKLSHILRYGLIAAAVVVLLCGTAFGWDFFRVIADWTTEKFYFLTGRETQEVFTTNVFEHLRVTVEAITDIPAVPHRAPQGTDASGNLSVIERKDRYTIGMGYIANSREFSIRIIIHDDSPEQFTDTYQKDSMIEDEFPAGGITHYIMGNNETLSAMWINGCVEGYIQGALTLEEMRQMIESIYEE